MSENRYLNRADNFFNYPDAYRIDLVERNLGEMCAHTISRGGRDADARKIENRAPVKVHLRCDNDQFIIAKLTINIPKWHCKTSQNISVQNSWNELILLWNYCEIWLHVTWKWYWIFTLVTFHPLKPSKMNRSREATWKNTKTFYLTPSTRWDISCWKSMIHIRIIAVLKGLK